MDPSKEQTREIRPIMGPGLLLPASISGNEIEDKLFRQALAALNKADHVAAERALKELIERVEERCHPLDPYRGLVRGWSALIAHLSGDSTRALDEVEGAIQLVTLGYPDISRSPYPSTPLVLLQLRSLKAELHTDKGQHDQAIATWGDVLDMADALQSSLEQHQMLKLTGLLGMASAAAAAGNTETHTAKMTEALFFSGRITIPQGRLNAASVIANSARKESKAGRFPNAAALMFSAAEMIADLPRLHPGEIIATKSEAAELLEKAGDFRKALTIRRALLKQTSDTIGSTSRLACKIRSDIAMSLLERGKFEEAELLLSENLTIANDQASSEDAIAATKALCHAYSQRGLLGEALRLLQTTEQKINAGADSSIKIRLYVEHAKIYHQRGEQDRAIFNIQSALKLSDTLPIPQNLASQAVLHYTLASILCDSDHELARHHLGITHEILVGLPPNFEPISREGLRLLSIRLSDELDTDTPRDGVYTNAIAEHTRLYGAGKYTELAYLLFERARARAHTEKIEGALEDLHSAREGLESRGLTETKVYALTLRLLSELLPDEDPQRSVYLDKCIALFERLRKSMTEE